MTTTEKPAVFREGYRYTVKWRTESVSVRCYLRLIVYLLQGRIKIEDRDSEREIPFCNPRPAQRRMIQKCLKQALKRKPQKVIGAKYRRAGISTISEFIMWFRGMIWRRRGATTIAHTADAADEIFTLARYIHQQHPILMGSTLQEQEAWVRYCQRMSAQRVYHEHSQSNYSCASGIANFVKTGSTLHDTHITEYSKYMNTSGQDKKAIRSVLNAMSQTREDTLVILEASGQGSDGDFPQRCKSAEKGEGNFELVFVPWHEDETLLEDEDEIPDGGLDPAPDGYELLLMKRYNITEAQLLWRRKKLADDFAGQSYFDNPPEFGWDYPACLDDLFSQKAGRIYLPFSRDRHVPREDNVAKFYPLPPEKYRFLDWNFSESTPATCIFVAVDRDAPPELIVFPACENFISEHLNYSRDKHGQPQKMNNHACDAFRIGVTTLNLRCRVIVYKEIYVYGCKSPTEFCRRIHKASGWYHPRGDKGVDLRAYRPGPNADLFKKPGVADRAQPGMINDFRSWGIPLVASRALRGATKGSAKGEVEDGIDRVLVLMEADSSYKLEGPTAHETALESAQKKMNREMGLGRRRTLNKKEKAAVKREYPQPEPESDFIEGPSRSMIAVANRMLRRPRP